MKLDIGFLFSECGLIYNDDTTLANACVTTLAAQDATLERIC